MVRGLRDDGGSCELPRGRLAALKQPAARAAVKRYDEEHALHPEALHPPIVGFGRRRRVPRDARLKHLGTLPMD